jgi:hypothetical protein
MARFVAWMSGNSKPVIRERLEALALLPAPSCSDLLVEVPVVILVPGDPLISAVHRRMTCRPGGRG